MAAPSVAKLLSICLSYFFTYLIITHGINLDTRFSVIKRGKPDTYFGFSVAQHQILDDFNNVLENVFLVGAPKENRTLSPNIFTGGAVYKCNANDEVESCQLMEDGMTTPPQSNELVTDQWLGVTVASQGPGKKAVACAHRYTKKNASLGLCHVFTQDLFHKRPIGPCEKQAHTRYLEDFGLCQAGMSASVGQDDAFVIGAPGSVLWQGVIFLANITDELGVSQIEAPSPYVSPKATEKEKQPPPTSSYSYNGYAVTMGRFDRTKTLYYVSGAPKSNSKGEVMFFRGTTAETLRYDPSNILQGKKEFSGFGSSLLAMDLNNDGFDDLIVGAPYYYVSSHGGAFYVYLGGQEMISGKSKYTEVLSRKMSVKECDEFLCEHARFGISLAGLGDINMDSFQDFAVGAPYEGNGAVYIYYGSSAAAGFNVKYAQRIIPSDLPVKGIKSFGYSLSGGMDLDNNGYPDLLVGCYESSAVALIRAKPIIRIIPRLEVSPKAVKLEVEAQCDFQFVKSEYKNRHCVRITMCLSFKTKSKDSIRTIPKVIYRLDAEPTRKVARVELQDAPVDNKTTLVKNFTLNSQSESCIYEIAILKTQFDDKVVPMEFKFTFDLETANLVPDSYPASATQDVNRFPVLDTEGVKEGQSNTVSVHAEFVMDCGIDNKCDSNLQFTAVLKDLKRNADGIFEMVVSQENQLHVIMTVTNEREPAYLTKIYVEKPVNMTYLGTDSQDTVTCQGLDNKNIVCDQIGNPFRQGKNVTFTLKLNVPHTMAETPDVYNLTVMVNTSSDEQTPENDRHILLFRVINKAEISLTTSVVPDYAILCKGEPRGASAMKSETDIGASVKHSFVIRNIGPGVISRSYINITWPYEVGGRDGAPGKYLLYLMRKPQITGPVIECNDNDIKPYINPHNIQEVNEPEETKAGAVMDGETAVASNADQPQADDNQNNRRKREATDARTKRAATTLVLSCHDYTAKCFEYRCKLGKLEPNTDYVKITMEARLWESTLISDYRKVPEVQIQSWGEITVPARLMITQDKSDDKRRAITRAHPDFKEISGQVVQWWIILVAVLVGLVVLLVVIFILYKLGFFRRKRMEDMQMYKAEKKQQSMLQDEYNDDGA